MVFIQYYTHSISTYYSNSIYFNIRSDQKLHGDFHAISHWNVIIHKIQNKFDHQIHQVLFTHFPRFRLLTSFRKSIKLKTSEVQNSYCKQATFLFLVCPAKDKSSYAHILLSIHNQTWWVSQKGSEYVYHCFPSWTNYKKYAWMIKGCVKGYEHDDTKL